MKNTLIIDPLILDDRRLEPLRGRLQFGDTNQIHALNVIEINRRKLLRTGPLFKMQPNPHPGKLIVVEGVDGSGKSTLAKALFTRLLKESSNTVELRMPGGCAFGEEIRKVVFESIGTNNMDRNTFRNLMACNMREIQADIILSLAAGTSVLIDRYVASDYAYATAHNEPMSRATAALQRECITEAIRPDLTIYLSGDPVVLLERAKARGQVGKAWGDKKDFAVRVGAAYEEFFAKDASVATIDAEQEPEAVLEQAWVAVKGVF